MAALIPVSGVQHIALVVTDLQRSSRFYSEVLGFQPLIDLGSRIIFSNGSVILALTLPAGLGASPQHDRFDENRVGLDHVSFTVGTHDALLQALQVFAQQGIPHGEIKDLGEGMRMYVLAFRDPDNIQLELTGFYA